MNTSQGARRRFGAALVACLMAASAAMLVTACGGGGGGSDDDDEPTAAGLWDGSMSDGRFASGVVLEDGTYYLVYGADSSEPEDIEFAQGTGSLVGGRFVSDDGVAYQVGGGRQAVVLDLALDPRDRMEGTISFDGTPVTLAVDYEDLTDDTPRLSQIDGSYLAQAISTVVTDIGSLDISSTGQLDLDFGACSGSGRVVPRDDINAFDITLNLDGDCGLPTGALGGVATWDEDDGLQLMIGVTQDDERREGLILVAARES